MPEDVTTISSTPSADLAIPRPAGIAYTAHDRALVVARAGARGVRLVRLVPPDSRRGALRGPRIRRASALSFDGGGDRLLVADRRGMRFFSRQGARLRATATSVLRGAVRDPRGATFDTRTRAWVILDSEARALVRIRARPGRQKASRVLLSGIRGRLRGVAFNPADGLTYVGRVDTQQLLGFDARGTLRRTLDVRPLGLADLRGMVFAPSADRTDDRSVRHLYMADAGGPDRRGRIVEADLTSRTAFAATTAPTIAPNLVQTIQGSAFGPPAPDTAGIAFMPDSGRFAVSDSEVDEMPIYQGVNVWSMASNGAATPIGTTKPRFSKEPSGLAYRPADRTLFISDDDADRISAVQPGPDGAHMTADDVEVGRISTLAFGAPDAEDVAFEPASGDVLICDGHNLDVYRVHPVNGVFGDADDIVTNFDIGVYGPRDCEGLGFDSQRNTVLALDPSTKKAYELTLDGALVRIIDLSALPVTNKAYADIEVAPTSNPYDSPTEQDYWIADRQVDNGADPNENDGKIYEVALPGADAAPTVSFTAPSAGATLAGNVGVSAVAADDLGVASVAFKLDGATLATDNDGSDGWSIAWDTTAASEGPHVLTAVAADSTGHATSATRAVTVDNFDSPPVVSFTEPAAGALLAGAVAVRASASDDGGVASVSFAVDGTALGTDTNSADGWSASWATAAGPDGPHTLTATATDSAGHTATASREVVVDNSAPEVVVTAPSEAASVSTTTTVAAGATDNRAVTSVQFRADGAAIGTDATGADGWSVAWDTTAVANGTHVLTAVARDAAGNTTTSAPVSVQVANQSSSPSIEVPVQTGADDVDELIDGTVRRTGGDLELGSDQGTPTTIGLRFTNVSIPAGATITNAHVQFQVDEKSLAATNLTVSGEAADNAAPYTTAAFNASARPRTTAAVAWAPPQWTVMAGAGPGERTPDLHDVVQEVVNRPGWASGNALAILVTGSGRRTAESFEGGAPPRLRVEYQVTAPTPSAPSNTAAPAVVGTAEVQQTLRAEPGTWAGTSPIEYSYQWRRCDAGGEACADIAGATSAVYALGATDAGHTVRVQVTAVNGVGSATVSSAPTDAVSSHAMDGLSQVAEPQAGSSDPTYYGSNHRVAMTAGGRMLVVLGKHATGVQLAYRDPGGTWRSATQGDVTDGVLLSGTKTGDWSASVALARDASGQEHAWVVWSAAATGATTKALQLRRLSALDGAGGPQVGPLVTLDAAANSPARPDIGFERAPDGSWRGVVTWVRRSSTLEYSLVAAWLSDLSTATPALTDMATLLSSSSATRNPTVAPGAGGVRIVARSSTDKLQRFAHDAAAPLTGWTASSLGVSSQSVSTPSAAVLNSGAVLAAAETNTTTHVVTVQRFAAGGAATVDLQLTGYAMPTLATDGSAAALVMVRQSDGYLVSRAYDPATGWSASDQVEVGAEGGGNYAWPNALREADGRLRFIVRGPAGGAQQSAVLAFQRPF